MTKKKYNKKLLYCIFDLLFLAVFVVLDQVTKNLAVLHLKDKSDYILWKDVFVLHYLENRGAAFGMLQNQKLFFVFGAIVILSLIIFVLVKMPLDKKYNRMHFCLLLIASGAIGNMIDRLISGYVIDFFYFEFINFPVFNVADIFVTIGTTLFIIFILFYYEDEDLNFLKIKIENNNLRF